jgi:hypothetical protein
MGPGSALAGRSLGRDHIPELLSLQDEIIVSSTSAFEDALRLESRIVDIARPARNARDIAQLPDLQAF